MTLFKWQATLEQGRGTPLVCLDYLPFARRVYGQNDARWFDAGPLLATCRQAQQGLKPDVMLFPLLDWTAAWWQAQGLALPQASRSTKALKLALENPALLRALSEVLQALATLNRADAAVALKLGSVEDWLHWISPATPLHAAVDEGDAEDVCVYLAALVNKLPAATFDSLFLHRTRPIDGSSSVAYAPLVNAAWHFGWGLVLCAQDSQDLPADIDLVASRGPLGGQGLWATDAFWHTAAPASPARFVVGTLLADMQPERVLSTLARLRASST